MVFMKPSTVLVLILLAVMMLIAGAILYYRHLLAPG
jgi:hypothetical protein